MLVYSRGFEVMKNVLEVIQTALRQIKYTYSHRQNDKVRLLMENVICKFPRTPRSFKLIRTGTVSNESRIEQYTNENIL